MQQADEQLEQKLAESPHSPDSIDTQERLDALLAYYLFRCEVVSA
jgi:hypothetical protein